ncbi:hypothetical protein E2C01_035632 [Portunus trituberculatus]|uniref:Uncharacterized protein n=1 Tax=Portunus trituberculatus TaxID=210409 RepID=A0A5B7F3N4_PORTR|nr:hypothetical protein [Portunus trituberculatus]
MNSPVLISEASSFYCVSNISSSVKVNTFITKVSTATDNVRPRYLQTIMNAGACIFKVSAFLRVLILLLPASGCNNTPPQRSPSYVEYQEDSVIELPSGERGCCSCQHINFTRGVGFKTRYTFASRCVSCGVQLFEESEFIMQHVRS